ncbi:MAG: FAD-binding oxidoreductase [Candidatus Hermodarchaeota archaeon]
MTGVIKRNIYENIAKEKVYDELVGIFGQLYVSDKPHNLYPYSYDATECEPHMPDFVVLPENVEQIQKLVKFCNLNKIPLVPYITGNNIGGLTIPQQGGIICDFGKRMNKIIKIHESLMYALLEPGVTFGQLKKHLNENHPTLKYGYTYAPPYASVVGNVLLSGLTNLSCSYGGMADWINGLEVVLNNGEVVRTGSCFISKELKYNNWFSRYPIPDLTGLFVCWQGMTGLVTKAAVQLWSKKEFNAALVVIVYEHEACAEVIRELGRSECCEDISAVSQEYAKMQFGLKKPKKLPKEPDYALIISISGQTKELLDAKLNYIKHILEKIKNSHPRIFVSNYYTFTSILGDKFKDFHDLPSVLSGLYEYDGLTWVGSYANPDNLGPLLEKTHQLYEKYEMGPIIFAKSMKAGHFCVFRPILRFSKNIEEEKVKELQHEFLEVMLDYDCVPYKTPAWMTDIIRKRCDPNWIKLFERIKKTMDPENIFNPGKWGT